MPCLPEECSQGITVRQDMKTGTLKAVTASMAEKNNHGYIIMAKRSSAVQILFILLAVQLIFLFQKDIVPCLFLATGRIKAAIPPPMPW